MNFSELIQVPRGWLPKHAWFDTFLLGGLIVVANCLLDLADFGWLKINPSPYFLLPVMIGCRYGFGAGCVAGGLGAVLIALGRSQLNGVELDQLIYQEGYFLGALVFVGGFCGEIQHSFRKKERQLLAGEENARTRLKQLDSNYTLLREAKGELERLLAIRGSELATFDSQLRSLLESDGEELFHNLLLLINRQARVSDAALYLLEPSGELRRKALMGSDEFLPSSVKDGEVEMMTLALKHKTTVTIAEFWQQSGGSAKNHLMAVPLLDSDHQVMGALLVASMPFISLNRKTAQTINLICRWASRILEIRSKAGGAYRIVDVLENQKIFTASFFRRSLELAFFSFREHQLPSSILLFTLPRELEGSRKVFEKALTGSLRTGDMAGELGLEAPHLAVLLPLTGERGAEIFKERLLAAMRRNSAFGDQIQCRRFFFDPKEDFEAFFKKLTSHAP